VGEACCLPDASQSGCFELPLLGLPSTIQRVFSHRYIYVYVPSISYISSLNFFLLSQLLPKTAGNNTQIFFAISSLPSALVFDQNGAQDRNHFRKTLRALASTGSTINVHLLTLIYSIPCMVTSRRLPRPRRKASNLLAGLPISTSKVPFQRLCGEMMSYFNPLTHPPTHPH
jgi:hypothetical protein